MVDFRQSFKKAHEKGITPAVSAHLDAIRGLAAIAVLLMHARHLLLRDWADLHHHNLGLEFVYGITEFGHQAVIVFFILSGFFIGPGVLRDIHTGRWSFTAYFVKRFIRLEIVLLPALLLCLFWDLSGSHIFGLKSIYGGHADFYPVAYNIQACISAPIFFGNLAFLQMIKVPPLGSDSPLWSLANEFWYYLLFPCTALALLSRKKLAVRSTYGGAGVLIVWLVRKSILIYFPIWLIGVLSYYLPKTKHPKSIKRAFLIASSVLFCLDLLSTKQYWSNSIASDYVLSGCFALFLYSLLNRTTTIGERYSRLSHGLASSSYTLYVVHLPLLVFLEVWIGKRWVPTPLHLVLTLGIVYTDWLYARGIYRLFEARTPTVRQWTEKKLKGLYAKMGRKERQGVL